MEQKNYSKKYISTVFIFFLVLFLAFPFQSTAQGILPTPTQPIDCKEYQKDPDLRKIFDNEEKFRTEVKNAPDIMRNVLGCAIKTGKIRLYMVPFFITSLIQFLLGIAGLVAVLFMVIGGYRYVVGGLIEDKESGKKTMMHALIGLVVALSAWIIVNFIQVALTS